MFYVSFLFNIVRFISIRCDDCLFYNWEDRYMEFFLKKDIKGKCVIEFMEEFNINIC